MNPRIQATYCLTVGSSPSQGSASDIRTSAANISELPIKQVTLQATSVTSVIIGKFPSNLTGSQVLSQLIATWAIRTYNEYLSAVLVQPFVIHFFHSSYQ